MSIFTNSQLFREPVWYKLTKNQILNLSENEVEDLRASQLVIDRENAEKLNEIRGELSTIKSLTLKLYGKHSKEFKYVDKFARYIPFSGGFKSHIIDPREQAKKDKEKAKREEEIKLAQTQYLTEAIAYLINKGKNIGNDFTAENAIDTANNLAYTEEVARKQELGREGTLFPFSGSDNCENCGGWDGVSRRCECGNRRVDWVSDHFDFRKPYIYGEAY